MDEEHVRDLTLAEAARPFDLERGPLLRMAVFRVAADDWIVLATTHHIVVDFWSLILMLSEVGAIYPRLAAGAEPTLPPAPGNYAEFVRRQDALLAGGRGAELKRYWADQLAGLPTVLELPTDLVRPKSFTGRDAVARGRGRRGRRHHAAGGGGAGHPVGGRARGRCRCFSAGIRRTSFVVGTPFSGRSQQKFESTVGFFVNMLPLPARLDDAPTFAALVARVGATLVGGLEHEDYPLASIVQDLVPERTPSRSPLFQVSCTFEKAQLREEKGRADSCS